jgi:flagellar biosynthesis anti-sigma factor FlgM
MAISIGGAGSQPVGEFIESTIDRVTSSQSNKVQEGAEASTSGSETTSLLAGASSLAALTATAMDSGGFRSDKVDQLRQAIASGSYHIEPNQVADAMLKEWQQRP